MSDYDHDDLWHRVLMVVTIVAAALLMFAMASLCAAPRRQRTFRRSGMSANGQRHCHFAFRNPLQDCVGRALKQPASVGVR